MKLVVFNVDNKKRPKKQSGRINYERILFISFIVSFILLVAVQAALTNPSVRTFLTVSNGLEGQPLEKEEFLYSEGKLTLKLMGGEINGNLKVLLNGDEAAVFFGDILDLSVKDGDVVEIDGSQSKGDAEIEVMSQSENITTQCVGKRIKVQSNIKKLLKVNVGK